MGNEYKIRDYHENPCALDEKVILYAKLEIAEYIMVDLSGEYLPEKLLLKRLQPDGTWKDERDGDGGVTSLLGFRLIIDLDGMLSVVDTETRRRYVRPREAQERLRELEAELERLRRSAEEK